MNRLEEYREDALALALDPFVEKYAPWFLVHIASGGAKWNEDMEWSTLHLSATEAPPQGEPIASWAVPVNKRPGNPHPDRISIGRARSCDVVLRYGFVSKLHAYLLDKGGRYSLMDLGSSNGTKVNGVALPNNESVRLEHGDRISLGRLELRFVGAEAFRAQLRRDEPPSSSSFSALPLEQE